MLAHSLILRAEQLVRRSFRVRPARAALFPVESGALAIATSQLRWSSEASQRNAVGNASPFVAKSCDALDVVMNKNRELRTLLKTLSWPQLMSFEAHGKTYSLPCHQAELSSHAGGLSVPRRLKYLAGFFDGDGCVRPNGLSGCSLAIGQSINHAGVLLLFLDMFGGRVRRHTPGVGLCRPMLRWEVGGPNASHAARLLAPYSIVKRQQLRLAGAWPQDKLRRQQFNKELQGLKRCDSAVVGHCTMEYIAGFFDAEGYVQQQATRTSLSLTISQKYVTVLECLKDSLAHCLSLDVQIYPLDSSYRLVVSRTSACKLLLQEMLAAGLFCKAQQAELALSLVPQNATQVREALADQVGNQNFGKRLDEDGSRRAREIVSANRKAARLKRRGELCQAESKLHEAEVLKQKHKLLKALHENQQLHDYACKLRSVRRLPTSEPQVAEPKEKCLHT
ncbi:MTERFD1 [Symbiodinium natans]|uniref:mTERFD1 protein n=1 Tax=Symbiodinium natans TaxID=878477 RepID=A0A812NLS9_9DINO|nr:MTERFD1 [Symbiodinium natans]